MASVVADDIKKVLGKDTRQRNVGKAGLEFLLSMGLTVKDPGDRIKMIIEAYPYALAGGLSFGRGHGGSSGQRLERIRQSRF
jgi:hypothetical protein